MMMSLLQWRGRVYGAALALCVVAGGSTAGAQSAAVKASDDTAKADAIAKPQTSDPKRDKILADTRRLLALSREVQAEITKNGPDTLSLAMLKKVEELQKLAATVKAEMGKVQ
jgi:hypothetical protein